MIDLTGRSSFTEGRGDGDCDSVSDRAGALGRPADSTRCGVERLRRHAVRERAVLDLDVDPPPDLAIEVDITHSSINRMDVYAGLRVPEVWTYDGHSVTFFVLGPDGHYQKSEESLSFRSLRPADVLRFIELGSTMDKIRWAAEIRDWVHRELIPRRAKSPQNAAGE